MVVKFIFRMFVFFFEAFLEILDYDSTPIAEPLLDNSGHLNDIGLAVGMNLSPRSGQERRQRFVPSCYMPEFQSLDGLILCSYFNVRSLSFSAVCVKTSRTETLPRSYPCN